MCLGKGQRREYYKKNICFSFLCRVFLLGDLLSSRIIQRIDNTSWIKLFLWMIPGMIPWFTFSLLFLGLEVSIVFGTCIVLPSPAPQSWLKRTDAFRVPGVCRIRIECVLMWGGGSFYLFHLLDTVRPLTILYAVGRIMDNWKCHSF